LRSTWLAPNEENLVYIQVLSLIGTKYDKEMSNGQVKFLAFGERNSYFAFQNLRKIWLAPNEVIPVYIEVLSLICTKYAKEMSIGANELSCVLGDVIHVFRTENCAKRDLHQMK
jgi:hypothetical protein